MTHIAGGSGARAPAMSPVPEVGFMVPARVPPQTQSRSSTQPTCPICERRKYRNRSTRNAVLRARWLKTPKGQAYLERERERVKRLKTKA